MRKQFFTSAPPLYDYVGVTRQLSACVGYTREGQSVRHVEVEPMHAALQRDEYARTLSLVLDETQWQSFLSVGLVRVADADGRHPDAVPYRLTERELLTVVVGLRQAQAMPPIERALAAMQTGSELDPLNESEIESLLAYLSAGRLARAA